MWVGHRRWRQLSIFIGTDDGHLYPARDGVFLDDPGTTWFSQHNITRLTQGSRFDLLSPVHPGLKKELILYISMTSGHASHSWL